MKINDLLTITNEDNMELMARYPDKYFDLAIVISKYCVIFVKKLLHDTGFKTTSNRESRRIFSLR